jgi:hypothetical protein
MTTLRRTYVENRLWLSPERLDDGSMDPSKSGDPYLKNLVV